MRKAAYHDYGSFAFLPIRVIALKASPVSFAVAPFDPNALVVSTIDRQVQRFNLFSGRLLQAFKPNDPASGDSVLTSSLQVTNAEISEGVLSLIIAVSATDKSIRLYQYDGGTLLGREQGQAAITAVKLLQSQAGAERLNHLVSCGMDGTVIVYNLKPSPSSQRLSTPCESPVRLDSPLKQTPGPAAPLRKTLTRSEIAEFQKLLEGPGDTISPLRSTSPSRLVKRTSRLSLAPRTTAFDGSSRGNILENHRSSRRSSQDHSSTSTSPKNAAKSAKQRSRPSLDSRRRSKSAANLNDLSVSADQLCISLHTFRKRVLSAMPGKIKPSTMAELRSELQLTVKALSDTTDDDMTYKDEAKRSSIGEDFDAYLAKVIDERLALKAMSKENQSPTNETEQRRDDNCQADATN